MNDREKFEAWYTERCQRVNRHATLAQVQALREGDGYAHQSTTLAWEAWQAREMGDVVVTKTEAGQIVAVTRQDAEGRILKVIAESASGVRVDAPSQACAPDGELAKAREKATRLTLNARQLHQAWQLANPDPGDEDQEETEITIRWWQGGKDTDGDDAPEGYYAHLAEYPEEGALFLDPDRAIGGVKGPEHG
jgi:hypothetical protein